MKDTVSAKYQIRMLMEVLLLCTVLAGCVYNVPLVVDPHRDMSRAFPETKKIPAKVGVYISDDLKRYVPRQQKMGIIFQMNIGEYLPPIGLQMGAAMFDEVIPVHTLPPYGGNYRPDVEAVVEPEILYCYGNAVGTLSGYIETKVKIRVTAYDLSGRIIWRHEALGENRSREMNFVDTFLGGMKGVGQVGYQAAFAAAVRIIDDFNARPPKELYSLLELKNMASLHNRGNLSNFELHKRYYGIGRSQYEKKNYYQALYSFEKASGLNPSDSLTIFYIGACSAYIGNKERAIEAFTRVLAMNPNGQEAADSRGWLKLLKEPLKIAVVGPGRGNSITSFFTASLRQALIDSRFYELTDANDLKPPASTTSRNEWNAFLERSAQKGVKVVIINDIESFSQKVRVGHVPPGDFATEHIFKISSKAYSAKKKDVRADIKIIERITTITEQSAEEERDIRGRLVKTGAQKLVRRLLEHDIY